MRKDKKKQIYFGKGIIELVDLPTPPMIKLHMMIGSR